MEDAVRHFVGNVTQKAVIEHDGKILVCRGIGDTVWEFPGGRLHEHEEPMEGVAREIKEELGIDVTVEKVVHISRSYHSKSKQWQVFVVYRCGMNGDIHADPKEVEEVKWVSRDELYLLPMFDDCAAARKNYFGVR